MTAEGKPVPHKKLGVEDLPEGGKLKPESIKSEDKWNGLWDKLRKTMAKTEEVETRIKKAQGKLSNLKDSMREGLTVDVPAAELAVKAPKDRLEVKAPDSRKKVGSREEKVEEDSGELGKEISFELEEKKELNEQKRKYSLASMKRFPDIAMEEIKRTLDVVRIENEDAKNIEETDRREDKTSYPLEDEERKTPRKHIGTLSRLAAKSRPDLARHVSNVARKQKGKNLKNKRERNRRPAIERSEKNRAKFEETGERENRYTEEDNDPPDKVCQTRGKSDESKEETTIGGEDKRGEMVEREEIVGELVEIIKEAIEVTTVRKIMIKRGVYGFRRKPMAMKIMRTRKNTRVSEDGSQTCPQMEVTTRAEETMKRDSKPKQGARIERNKEDPQKYTSRGKGGDDTRMRGGDDIRTIGGDNTRMIGGDDTKMIGGEDTRMIGGDDTQTIGGDDTRTRGEDETRISRNKNKGGGDDERISSNPV